MPTETATNSEAGILGDVSLADLASALPIESEYLEHFKGATNEEVKTDSDPAIVADEEKEAVVEGDETVESTETAETEAEETEAENEEEEKDPDSKLPVSVQKRIDKLTAEKHAIRDEADGLKATVADLTTKLQNAPVRNVPVSNVEVLPDIRNVNDLNLREQQARATKKFCMQNPEGGVVKGTDKDGNPTERLIPPEEIRTLLVNAEELLTEKIPYKRDYLTQTAKYESEARAYYPKIFTNGTVEGQSAVQFVNMAPWVRSFPDWHMVIGDYISGRAIREAATKAKAAPQRREVPAVKPLGAPKPAAGGSKVSANKKSMQAVIGERNGDITIDDAAGLLASLM